MSTSPAIPADLGSTRLRILDAAMELFHRQGFADSSISQIRDEAGVSASSLYHFFPSKDDLLLAVLEQYRDAIGPGLLQEALAGEADPIDRVFALLERYRRMLLDTGFRYGCPIGNLALELGPHHDEARARVRACFDHWTGAVEGVLREGPGELSRRTEPATLATFILTVLEGAIMQAIARHDIAPFDTALAHLRDYLDRLDSAG